MRIASAPAALAVGCALVATACGATAATPQASPRQLLDQAKRVIDASPSVHFVLASSGAQGGSGTLITGGEGDIARPDQLRGRFVVTVSGLPVSLQVLAGAGKFYVQAPFQTTYALTDPSTYGVGNPALLIDPVHGLSSLLPAITAPKALGQVRVGGEIVDQIQGDVPGSDVPVLPDDNPSVPVSVTVAIAAGTHQVREVTLVGPFASTKPSTYTVTLTAYGAPVHVTLPAG